MDAIDIHQYRKKIAEANKFSPLEDRTAFIHDLMLKGITFQGILYKTTFVKMDNVVSKAGFVYNYYFICPLCEKKAIRLYNHPAKGYCCCKCAGRKYEKKGNQNNLFKLQKDFQVLYEGKMTSKKRSQLLKNIGNRFNHLSSTYKNAYNNIAFKELTKWCSYKMIDKTLDPGYKQALKDVYEILKSIKKILIQTELSKKN